MLWLAIHLARQLSVSQFIPIDLPPYFWVISISFYSTLIIPALLNRREHSDIYLYLS